MNFELLQGLLRISAINRNYGGDYCFTGFPAETGNGSMFQLDLKFGISIQSDKQSGALEFLRFAISEEGQAANIGPGFFASEAVFSKALNTALSDGIKVQDYHYEFTESDAEKLRTLVNETTALSSSDFNHY